MLCSPPSGPFRGLHRRPPHDVLPRRPTTPVVTQDPATVWPRIQDELRRAVPASSYEIWLAPLHPVALDEDELVLQVPTALHHWVAERFGRVLQSSVAAVLGPSAGSGSSPAPTPAGAPPGRPAATARTPVDPLLQRAPAVAALAARRRGRAPVTTTPGPAASEGGRGTRTTRLRPLPAGTTTGSTRSTPSTSS